jgi:anti-sigma B factor antagonist
VTPYELEVREPQQPGVTIVALAGELDLTNAPEIERRLEQMPGVGLVLDLNGVTFLDSAALHMLFRLARRGGGESSFGIVLEPTAVIARTLAIVGMAEVATVRPSIDELVADPLS